MKILSIGNLSAYGVSNTCLHRHWALEKIAETIDAVDTAANPIPFLYRLANFCFQKGLPVRLPDTSGINKSIKSLVSAKEFDIVWIDKGLKVNRSTLKYIKKKLPKCKIVSFSPDNMTIRHNQSQNYLDCVPLYDATFTTKSYILDDLEKLGAKNVHFIHKTYEKKFHYPRILTDDETERLGGDVGFIGAWEEERCQSILYLADNGIKVKVFGDHGWTKYIGYSPNLTINKGLFSDDYPKALQAFKISLCFLRKMNLDQQTARSIEIPACGGFMLAARTDEHRSLFEEGKEADYFSSDEELLQKCIYYLSHDDERAAIAKAGTLRCKVSGYSNEDTINKMISQVLYGGDK